MYLQKVIQFINKWDNGFVSRIPPFAIYLSVAVYVDEFILATK
uniref:Uncharacterized protein n=1 Tax=Nelumbo nucifera TaxID=4432 RepID=A0A822YHK4_NELNU|nr:TPA_asm: hypothetical protein HUJ06_010464 [Nelumbo nucifera]